MHNAPEVIVHRPSQHVAMVQLNRQQQNNALSLTLQQQLSEHFIALTDDPAVRCIVLTGGEKVFAAGGDIHSMTGIGPIEIHQRHTERLWAPLQQCPKPVIAAVCGYAYGGGCELALSCDIIIAGTNARFAQPEVSLGIMPGIGGTQRLVRAIGKAKAMWMTLTGQPINAEQAFIAGLVSELVEDSKVLEHSLKLAEKIAAMPPLAVEQIKQVMLSGMDAPLHTALALERNANAVLFASRDQKEGMQAFVEKRGAQFEGR